MDHVIARSWYPANVPKTFQRYTVRACYSCNTRLGQIEKEILHRLALCLNPQESAIRHIVEGMRRAIDPAAASDPADRSGREAEWRRLQADMVDATDIPEHQIAAWTRSNRQAGQPSRSVRIPMTFEQIAEKWVRGIHFKTTRAFLPEDYVVRSILVTDEHEASVLALIRSRGETLAPGPGVQIERWSIRQEGLLYALYSFTIWDVFSVYASASPRPFETLKMTAAGDVIIV